MNTKIETNRQRRAAKQAALDAMVQRLIDVTADELSTKKFDTACEYMDAAAMSTEIAHEFLKERMFWNWWRQQWALIDEQFVAIARRSPMKIAEARALYCDMHASIDVYPDKIIYKQIHDKYAEMAASVIEKHLSV